VEYRQLGDSDLRVSELCLGTWTTFGASLEEEAAVALVDSAFDVGVNFFDTANIYSEGRSEEVLGRALAGRPRDSFVVATKLLGEMPDGDSGRSTLRLVVCSWSTSTSTSATPGTTTFPSRRRSAR
jgi:aryl-alcohol dehydrogenase-like predicted oxidoreductase